MGSLASKRQLISHADVSGITDWTSRFQYQWQTNARLLSPALSGF
jgi:hypothetical protein